MALIFIGSGNALSSAHTSRFLGPLLHWLLPHAAEATVDRLQFAIRKCGHLTEYAILAGLYWHALGPAGSGGPRPWRWHDAGLSLVLAAAYASSDEFHQSFVPSRQSSVGDVLIDTAGALASLLLLWAFRRWQRAR